MPPKQRITREMILERSFAMFSREGMEAVNARSVAKALNCSTQPIFSYFSGMEDLKNALEQKAKETFDFMLAGLADGGDPIVRICSAYVRFAAQQPRLFAHLFLKMSDRVVNPFMEEAQISDILAKESALNGLTPEQSRAVLTRMTIFAHGFAAFLAAGQLSESVAQQADQMLEEAHGSIVASIRAQQ